MQTIQTHTLNLVGSSYEIGCCLGKMVAEILPLKTAHTSGMAGFDRQKVAEAVQMFDRWCPGLAEELNGFAQVLGASPEQIFFYGMTYLVPRCSQIALLPSLTKDAKPLLARNYEFCHKEEDFCLVKTSVQGKYTHLGTSVLQFGREEGLNEHGLAVTMSSCGFPVGGLPFMRPPKLKGLQFWAVIRALLENCKDTHEALVYLKDMPIAYNLNMILLDKAGNAALVETLDGKSAVKQIGPDSTQQMIHATNHAVLPGLKEIEPQAMPHSVLRYDWIKQRLQAKTGVTKEMLKEMLLSNYPDGLCCHYFEEYFGTTKSLVLSPADGTIELCWGGQAENGWQTYAVFRPLENGSKEIKICLEKAPAGTYG